MRVLVLVLLLLFAPMAQAYSTEDSTFTSHDGTELRIRTHTPEGDGPFPAILATHGWNENIDDDNPITYADRYAQLGYLVVTYDSRGWGESGGEVELDGPNEIKDAQALITHIAGLDNVVLDDPEDPRIGMVGQSYAGGIQILVAQEDPRIDAIVPTATWSNLLHSLAPDDVIKRGWVDLLYFSGQGESRGVPVGSTDPDAYDPMALDPTGGPSSKLSEWYATAVAQNGPSDEMREEVGVVRSLQPGTLQTPTFLVQGWPDTLFTAEDALTTFQDLRLRGVDARLALGHLGHGGFGDYNENETIMAHVDDFLGQHLKDEAPSLPPYPLLRHRYATQDMVGEMQWPPAGTAPLIHYITDDGLAPAAGPLEAELTVPPVPAQCTEVSNFQGQSSEQCPQSAEGTTRLFTSEPLEAATEITGAPQVLVYATTTQSDEMFLFFQLVDVDADEEEQPVLYQVKPVRVPAGAGAAFVDMHAISHTFEEGHRIGIRIGSTDLSYHGSREPGTITLQGSASQPSIALLPMVPPDMHGDRVPPTIDRRFDVTMLEGNDTTTFEVTLRDDLALGNHTVTGDGAEVETELLEDGITTKRLLVRATAARCGVATVEVQVEDLAGQEAVASWDVVPCIEKAEEGETDDGPGKKSPAPLLWLPLAAALWLRRRQ